MCRSGFVPGQIDFLRFQYHRIDPALLRHVVDGIGEESGDNILVFPKPATILAA